MLGRGGLFRQENIEKRRIMSVREWAELCLKDDFRAPGVSDVGLHSRSANANMNIRTKTRRGRKKMEPGSAESAEHDPEPEGDTLEIKQERESVEGDIDGDQDMDHSEEDNCLHQPLVVSPPNSVATPLAAADGDPDSRTSEVDISADADAEPVEPESTHGSPLPEAEDDKQQVKSRPKRTGQTREAREASLADRAARDAAFLQTFDPHTDWLPPGTKASDYTPEFCQKLERQYWRNCGLGKPAWYGADTQGVFTTYLCYVLYEVSLLTNGVTMYRLPVYARHHLMECCTSSLHLIETPPRVIQRPSGREHAVPLLWHVARNICMARRRHGPI